MMIAIRVSMSMRRSSRSTCSTDGQGVEVVPELVRDGYPLPTSAFAQVFVVIQVVVGSLDHLLGRAVASRRYPLDGLAGGRLFGGDVILGMDAHLIRE